MYLQQLTNAELDSYLAMQHRAHASGPTTQVSGWHSPDKSVAAVLPTPGCPGRPSPRYPSPMEGRPSMSLCWPPPSPYDTWQNAGLYRYLTWSVFVSWVWALRSSRHLCVWPEAKRSPSGGRQPCQTSLMDLAAASETLSLCLLGALADFSGILAADLEALVFGVHTPAVSVVFEALAAVSSGRTALEDLAVEFEQHVVSFWVHAVVELGALAAELGALRIGAAWAAVLQRRGKAA